MVNFNTLCIRGLKNEAFLRTIACWLIVRE